jgi:GT2 family glycosyltransferase
MRVSAVLVAYHHGDSLPALVRSLRAGSRPVDEVVVVDNAPEADSLAALAAAGVEVRGVAPAANRGFAGGCNDGAKAATGDILLFVNPDAIVDPTCVDELLAALARHPGAVIAGAQILLADGVTTNAGENPVHPTCLSWAGRLGEPAEDGAERPVLAISGAGFAVRRDAWELLGGFRDAFFLYCEDTDLCLRAGLIGAGIVFVPRARVIHDYAFAKPAKWRYLERNRTAIVLTVYRARTLLLLAPVLGAAEVAILVSAARGGFLGEKLHAYRDLIEGRSRLRRERSEIQATRVRDDEWLLARMRWTLDSPVLAGPLTRLAAGPLKVYGTIVARLL